MQYLHTVVDEFCHTYNQFGKQSVNTIDCTRDPVEGFRKGGKGFRKQSVPAGGVCGKIVACSFVFWHLCRLMNDCCCFLEWVR